MRQLTKIPSILMVLFCVYGVQHYYAENKHLATLALSFGAILFAFNSILPKRDKNKKIKLSNVIDY